MSYTYARRKNAGDAVKSAGPAEGPQISELAAGARPSDAQIGSRVDLPGEIREKMENSFGADFSNVKLYESDTVAEAGAEAVTQGNNVAFAPGKLDLTSTAGQALLGHELSHVVSQARGESAGQGFLNDAHLEEQADRQGEMAAQGQSVYEGPVSPIGASSTVSATGPMQAKKKTMAERKADKEAKEEGALYNSIANATAQRGEAEFGRMDMTSSLRLYNEMAESRRPAYSDRSVYDPIVRNTFSNLAFDGDKDLARAYQGKFGLQFRKPSDPSGQNDGGYHNDLSTNFYDHTSGSFLHPRGDALEGYDDAIAGGVNSVRQLQAERRRRGITG